MATTNTESPHDSYKCRTAHKLGIPVVSTDYIDACIAEGRLLDTDPYIIYGKTKSEELKQGKIVGKFH